MSNLPNTTHIFLLYIVPLIFFGIIWFYRYSKGLIRNPLADFCDISIGWGVPILVFYIALSFYLKTYDSAMIKITQLHIGGTFLIICWLAKTTNLGLPIKRYHYQYIIPVLLFLISGILSHVLFSSFKTTSFEELIRRFIYIGLFFIALFEFNNLPRLKRLSAWVLGAAILSLLYGVVQFLDIDPFIWRRAFKVRIFSTFGNPNFFAAWLIIIFPLIVTFFDFTDRERIRKVFISVVAVSILGIIFALLYYVRPASYLKIGAFGKLLKTLIIDNRFFALSLFILISSILIIYLKISKYILPILSLLIFMVIFLLTGTKAAFIGFGAAVCVLTTLVTIFLVKAPIRQKRIFLMVALTIVILVTSLGVTYMLTKKINSLRFRVLTWISTMEMVEKHPIRGTGIGTFKIVYPAYRAKEIFGIEGGKHNTETDHPENEFLEVWYDEGLIGLGIFLWILFIIFRNSIVRMKQNSRILFVDENFNSKSKKPHIINISISQLYLVALISGISGMLVHNLMGVNLRFVSSGHIFWIFLGVSAGMSMYSPDSGKEEERLSPPKQGFSIKIVLSLILILLLIPGFFFFRKYFIADIHHNIAIAYSKIKRWDEALRHYNKVLEHNPYFIMTYYFMGNVYNDRWDMESKHNPEWDGPDGKPRNDAERALGKYADVKVLAPNYVMVHYQEGLIYQKLQLWKKAIESFKKALALDPIFPLTHFHMGLCYAQLEDLANSEESFKESIKWNPRFVQAHINLGNVYQMEKKYKLAEEAYQKAVEVNPRYLDARKNLAVFYERVGNIPHAIEAWQGILDIDPEHKEAKNAIKGLKGKKGR